ncbi:GNAT family N-acetyltransferase [Archangium sp.]|uniref:GNAT family N-acetyltransferase n=1 Tax=Archangium sp. TaxID=1872627 RepID=UPI002D3367DC|nr:GNAT family N-acetyltransferase [Archangium sp.]HYO51574.1 GNAT family N-acetyltransferase [Archangium sp.]
MAPPTEPIIRMLLPSEAAAFWALRLRALREHPECFASSVEEEENLPLDVVRARLESQSPGTNLVLGAFVDGRLVGMTGIRRDTFRKTAHKARIWGMYVVSELQARGVGRRLLEAAIDAGRRMGGVEQLHLEVVVDNARARALYRSLGFQSYGVEKRALRMGEAYADEELMFLMLRG